MSIHLADNESRTAAPGVVWFGAGVNVVLALGKLLAGILGRSSALVADGVHSFSDLATDAVVLISLRLSRKPVDSSHDFGHGKMETLGAALVGIALISAGTAILWSAVNSVIQAVDGNIPPRPEWAALLVALVSIAGKEGLFQLTLRAATKHRSNAIAANAWHHRSDAFSSIATTLGILGTLLLGPQWRVLDPIAAIVVSALIFQAAAKIIKESIDELVEKSLDKNTENEIVRRVAAIGGANRPHSLRTRKIGNTVAVNLHVLVPPSLRVDEAHEISTEVEKEIKEMFGPGAFVSVHIEPLTDR